MSTEGLTRQAVGRSLARSPIIGVVRTDDTQLARSQAESAIRGGLELVEITFTVPEATRLVGELRGDRDETGRPWIGMGTVTTGERARQAVDAGAEFLVSPNVSREVAEVAREAGLFLVLGALSATEIVDAVALGADIVKVYPLPPVGGARYLATVRQPLGDLPMLAAGGFSIDEIPDYRAAGASGFGIGVPLFGAEGDERHRGFERALAAARGEPS